MRSALVALLLALPPAQAAVVLLDPGHGGEETGAVGETAPKRRVMEKDLALRLAHKIRDRLRQGATVFLTRSLDRHVSLQDRAAMADKVKADLFISVHFNSSPDHAARGFETYYLDNNQDAAVKKVERQENITASGEDMVINQILVDLVIQQTVTTSRSLAREVHAAVKTQLRPTGMSDRGIKAGLFHVLALSKRPGLLLEAGFVSNPRELGTIKEDEFLERYATGVARGVLAYLKRNGALEGPRRAGMAKKR